MSALTTLLALLLFAEVGGLRFKNDPCPLKCRCEDNKEVQTVDVSCQGAHLANIPHLPRHTALFDLNFKQTDISYIQDSAFINLPKLNTIRLRSRVKWSFGERPFKGLAKLSNLLLRSKSGVTKELKPGILTDLTFLRNISLRSIPIRVSVKNQLCPLVHLQEIFLSYNGLISLGFHRCFLNFRNLRIVRISMNRIEHIRKKDFANLRYARLNVLAIENCRIKTIEAMSFSTLKHLSNVSFMGNELRELTGDAFYGNLTDKFRLNLGLNSFQKLPCAFLKVSRGLASLDMDTNHVGVLKMCPGVIPHLKQLSYLSLLGNNIRTIDNAFFEALGVMEIQTLKIGARSIPNGSFATIKSLEHLEISHYLSMERTAAALIGLSKTNIQFLKVCVRHAFHLTKSTFTGLRGSKLKHLILSDCLIKFLDKGTFANLTFVHILDLSGNKIISLVDGVFEGLVSLKVVYLRNNNLIDLNELHIEPSLTPELEQIWLDGNKIDEFPCKIFTGFKNLSHISVRKNEIRTIWDSLNIPKLTFLDLSKNRLARLHNNLFNNAKNLKSLDLSFNKLNFGRDVDDNALGFLRRLTYLNINIATLSPFYKYYSNFFRHRPELKELRAVYCQINHLSKGMFFNTSNLEILDLRQNKITELEPEVFTPLQKLTEFYLYKNRITYLSQDSFKHLFSLKILDLTYNQLICDCHLIKLISWALDRHILLRSLAKPVSYICSAPVKWAGKHVLDFDMSKPDCEDYTILTLSLSVSATVAVVLCLALLGRHYRYYILYGMYYIRTKVRRMREATDDTVYIYDAFVGYCSTDMKWIVEQLLPEIENERGYKLCLHHRDWLAGPSIVDNIMQSVENSRKVILVVTKEFAKSYWCQVETSLSQTRQMEGQRNTLIVVLLEKVASRHMSGSLRHLLTSQTYLPWPADNNNRKLFWKRLTSALKKPKRTPMHD